MKISVKDRFRHLLNPLHLYCSLSHLLEQRNALKTAMIYEKIFYHHR